MTVEAKGRGSKSTRLRREIFLGRVMITPHVKEFLKHLLISLNMYYSSQGLGL